MPDVYSFFQYEETKKLLSDLLDSVLSESGRGALLIATAHVEEHLTELLKVGMSPDLLQKNYEKLFRYPGPLSSFSAKLEMCHAFRLIDKWLYTRINSLRKLRNDAAHLSKPMNLYELQDKVKEIYNFGQGVNAMVADMAVTMMIKFKIQGAHKIFDDLNVASDKRQEHISRFFQDEENKKMLDRQLPHYELIIGLSLMCGLITAFKYKLADFTKGKKTWVDILEEGNEDGASPQSITREACEK